MSVAGRERERESGEKKIEPASSPGPLSDCVADCAQRNHMSFS